MISRAIMAFLCLILGFALTSIGVLVLFEGSSKEFNGDVEYAFKSGLVAVLFGTIILLLGSRCL